jgi:hypothetical protein
MNKELKKRMDRIEEKISPSRYARIEDLIKIIELEEEEGRTPEQECQLQELRSLPIDPQLEKTITELEEKSN